MISGLSCRDLHLNLRSGHMAIFVVLPGFKLDKKLRKKFRLFQRKFRSLDLNFQFAYILYIFTSPSAENNEKFVHLGRLFLSSRPVGYSLIGKQLK